MRRPACSPIRQALLILAVLACGVGSGSAQTPAPPLKSGKVALLQQPITLAVQKKALAAVMTTLAAKIGCSFVIDGEPVLKQADFDLTGSAQEALDQVADTFDYTWTMSKRGVILMHKRFHNRDEYPQTNMPEMRQMTQDIVTALSLIPLPAKHINWGVQLDTLLQNCTPTQQQQLIEGKSLRFSDLTPPQQEQLQQIVYNRRYDQLIRAWQTLLADLDAFPSSYLEKRVGVAPPPSSEKQTPATPPAELWDFVLVWMRDGIQWQPVLKHWSSKTASNSSAPSNLFKPKQGGKP